MTPLYLSFFQVGVDIGGVSIFKIICVWFFTFIKVRRTLELSSWYHARKLYIRRSNDKFDSVKTVRIAIDHLLPSSDQENSVYIMLFLVTDEKVLSSLLNLSIYRPVEMKKILGGYQSRNIVGHHGWPTRKIFHFKSSKTARKT